MLASIKEAALWIILLLILFIVVWRSYPELESQLIKPVPTIASCASNVPFPASNPTGAKTVTAKVLSGQRGEIDFGRSLTSRTLVIDLQLSGIPRGSGTFHVHKNLFLRDDDAALNNSDISGSAATDGKVLVLKACFKRNAHAPLGDPGSYSGSFTIDDSRLSAPVTVPLTVTMQYSNGVFLLWLYFAAVIPGAWCVWVLRSSRNGNSTALDSSFFTWARSVGGLVALVSGGVAAFAVYTAVYLRDPTWGSSALQPLTLFGGMFSAFVTTSGLASLSSQKTLP
jgi:hypothetical protein